MVNDNPNLLDGFATDENSLLADIPALLESMGWSLTNSKINGMQMNTLFNQIFGYLNFLQSKGLSFWQDDKPYVADANNIDIVRRGNKIYFAKQNSNQDPVNTPAPKAPESNPDYWGLLLDLDDPIHEKLSNHNHDTVYLKIGGDSTKKIKALAGTADDDVVVKSQISGVIQTYVLDTGNCDAFIQNGMYRLKNVGISNMPVNEWGTMIVSGNQVNLHTQEFTSTSGRKFFRTHYIDTWSSWIEIFNKDIQITARVLAQGQTTPPNILGNFNVSDVVKISTGQYRVVFATPMDNTNYTPIISGAFHSGGSSAEHIGYRNLTVNSFELVWTHTVYMDANLISIAVVGGKN